MPYIGFLYAGLMIDAAGQPEGARIQLPPRRPGDAADHAAAEVATCSSSSSTRSTARSTRVEAEWDRRAALGVVLAAHGYPDEPRKGDAITGLPTPRREDCQRVPRRHRARDGKAS